MENKQPKYSMDDLLQIMRRLRKECPWDAKQTHESLRQFLLEETYEVLETIDQQQWSKLAEELGDLLLQIVFHSEIAAEKRRFDFNDVVDHISKKLITRHPHVFGNKALNNALQVQENWEHTKVKNEGRDSLLSGVPKAAPALLQAQRLQEKAATVGFDWPEVEPVLDKVIEELNELREEIKNRHLQKIEDELGDVLFALVNLGRFINITAEDALRKTNQKFVRRFQHIEQQYNGDLRAMKKATLKELDRYWEQAKENEK
ncbi:MAG TPA: nucleoside triphosphate pyrophosphohydrolase [Caldithrix abyssi]|uniref:Nucleoside triphosphate pyrophosphohydrolase n=1 Tax=Caldithrix abyssi TaxID=187145 RepID=A0A7V5LJ59_CALAY|nr:nucleoside triphosphate pyrophosphohydrolase [Caldithrix abyssi]